MSGRILVVDDESDSRELVSFNLRKWGYEVFCAANGLEALSRSRSVRPDLVILDLMMGGMDGYSVCEALQHGPLARRPSVLILTAAKGEIVRLNGLAAGAEDFLTKPFRVAELLRRVKAILRRRESAPTRARRC